MSIKNNLSKGFTITELTLAMGMLAIMMFILLISTMQFTSIYNKGITLKRVNQSGRAIGNELQKALRSAHSSSLNRRLNNTPSSTTYVTGICTGDFSYVWNVASPTNGATSIVYDDGTPVAFAKVNDTTGAMCSNPGSVVQRAQSTELLGDGLIIRDPTGVSFAPGGKLVSVTFTISTNVDTDIDDTSGRSKCAAASKNDFCALNTFLVTAYAKGV